VIFEPSSRALLLPAAAEVLEAHLLACLTGGVEHLILIGDHQQLRPATAVYRLETHYGLGISMFERLVRNGLPHVTLARQRRMRPGISALVAHLYPGGLQDHPRTLAYPHVSGFAKDVFFLDHSFPEDAADGDSASKGNSHEAAVVHRLARHLLSQVRLGSRVECSFYVQKLMRPVGDLQYRTATWWTTSPNLPPSRSPLLPLLSSGPVRPLPDHGPDALRRPAPPAAPPLPRGCRCRIRRRSRPPRRHPRDVGGQLSGVA
jgi:hypothetical protein